MPPCPKPVHISCPIPTHDHPSHLIYTGDQYLKCQSQNYNNFVYNYIFVGKSHMHILNMLEISVHSFKLCLKSLRRVDYTILLPLTETSKLIVLVKNAVMLSKIIFSPAKSHMHVFNMLKTSLLSLYWLYENSGKSWLWNGSIQGPLWSNLTKIHSCFLEILPFEQNWSL